jgi:cell division protease FtsH
VAFEIDKAVRKIIEEAHANAEKLLLEHKDQVILVAERLLDKETITAEEIEYLCKNGRLPDADKPAEEPKAEKPAEEPKPEASAKEEDAPSK